MLALHHTCGFAVHTRRVPRVHRSRMENLSSRGLATHAIARVLNVASVLNILQDDTKSSDKTRLFREYILLYSPLIRKLLLLR